MIWLSGCVRSDLPAEVGEMCQPISGHDPSGARSWAADTGCFVNPAKFRLPAYLGWLATYPATDCLFATAPDVVGDAVATLATSLPVLRLIRDLGYPAALVAQDGLESLPVPWDDFDCLFVGGTTAWKLSEAAYALVAEAKARGKWAHMGRCNSLRRLRAAMIGGYDSADGTFLAFGPDTNLPRVRQWLDALRDQPPLFVTGVLP